ncbi:MAG: hypothetical protein IPK96_15175 [Flammeovirgaceae bacterium]|jgi:hypothetical protein|nr:hypothetical protein [Flammeovirgaceae bacterium]
MPINQQEKSVLAKLIQRGGTGNVIEFLQDGEDFDIGFHFANEMQNKDLVKLLYSNFNKNLIVVELTLLGIKEGKE